MSINMEALRQMAERGATEHERDTARIKLARALARRQRRSPYEAFRSYLRTGSMEDLNEACRTSTCVICGKHFPSGLSCPHSSEHAQDHANLREKFPRGLLVYYNYWAYPENCPAVVSGYTATVGWIRLKFDHLKNARAVPIFYEGELRLSDAPMPSEIALRMRRRHGAGAA